MHWRPLFFFATTLAWATSVNGAPASQPADLRLHLTFVYASSCDACVPTAEALSSLVNAGAMQGVEIERIDADARPAAVAALQVTTTPTLRVTDADGRMLASTAGPADAAAIRSLLATAADRARASDTATSGDLATALASLDGDDRAASERAIGWIGSHADGTVIEGAIDRFASGTLRVRLALLPLLTRWSAPVDGLDPWRPETIGPTQVAALRAWARDRATTLPATRPSTD